MNFDWTVVKLRIITKEHATVHVNFLPLLLKHVKFLIIYTARRNEEITCDEILLMLAYFRKFNSILQNGLTASYYKIVQTDSTAFNDYLFFPKVYLSNQNFN